MFQVRFFLHENCFHSPNKMQTCHKNNEQYFCQCSPYPVLRSKMLPNFDQFDAQFWNVQHFCAIDQHTNVYTCNVSNSKHCVMRARFAMQNISIIWQTLIFGVGRFSLSTWYFMYYYKLKRSPQSNPYRINKIMQYLEGD